MKITVKANTFLKALRLAGRAVSGRSTIPILSHYLLMADGKGLRVTASNRDVAISVWVDAEVETSGGVTMPAGLLRDFVSNLPNEDVAIEVNDRTFTSKLACGSFTANIKGMSSDDFPIVTIGEAKTRERFTLPVDTLRDMIKQVTFAASGDAAKPTLQGVSTTLAGASIKMASTDGYRLGVRYEEVGFLTDRSTTIIIPAKTLDELAELFKEAADDADAEMEIVGKADQVAWRFEGKNGIVAMELVASLTDARYPDYMAIVPKSFNTRCTADVAAMQKALKVALLFARDNANIIYMECNPGRADGKGSITVKAQSTEMGDNVATVPADVEGDGLVIAFDVKLFTDMLATFTEATFAMELTQPVRPGLIYPTAARKANHFCVLMPMHPQRAAAA